MRNAVMAGLGFGDEGKGSVVDAMVRRYGYNVVVRYNGGAQAGHNVVTDDGRHHCFSQFGSGTFVPGCRTFLSRHMLVNPGALLNEEAHLQSVGVTDAFSRMSIDCRALVTTPYHQLANQAAERHRGDKRHGSCGMGIGATVRDAIFRPREAIRVGDLLDFGLEHKLQKTMRAVLGPDRCHDALLPSYVAHRMQEMVKQVEVLSPRQSDELLLGGGLLFEGAQGILLDEDHGFHPHTTWSRTTMANALSLLREAGNDEPPLRIGVTRTFMTRHGAGPFPTENEKWRKYVTDDHNATGEFQGVFRVGEFDSKLFKYAIEVNGGLDALAVTHMDKEQGNPYSVCAATRVPVKIESYGPRYSNKVFIGDG